MAENALAIIGCSLDEASVSAFGNIDSAVAGRRSFGEGSTGAGAMGSGVDSVTATAGAGSGSGASVDSVTSEVGDCSAASESEIFVGVSWED